MQNLLPSALHVATLNGSYEFSYVQLSSGTNTPAGVGVGLLEADGCLARYTSAGDYGIDSLSNPSENSSSNTASAAARAVVGAPVGARECAFDIMEAEWYSQAVLTGASGCTPVAQLPEGGQRGVTCYTPLFGPGLDADDRWEQCSSLLWMNC